MPHPAAFYPPTYRQLEVQTIVAAIRGRWSVVISGLAGAGKSHLMRFLAWNESFKRHYWAQDAAQLAFFFVDCNAIDELDEHSFYRGVTAALGQQSPLLRDIPLSGSSSEELLVALQGRLTDLYREHLTLVLILDRFEKLNRSAKLSYILDGLRYLRDYFARHISYVLAVRGETDITSISEEFQDLLYSPAVVYLKPLVPADAQDSIERYEKEYNLVFDQPVRHRLISYTGGYPRLLQVACDLTREGRVDLAAADAETIAQLSHAPQIETVCQKIWEGLASKDRATLRQVAAGGSMFETDSLPARYGLIQVTPGGRPRIFCPLFEIFCQENRDLNLTLELIPPNKVLRGIEVIQLAPLEINFLACLLENPGQVCLYDDIVARVYPEAIITAGVSAQALAGLARRVRSKINLPGLDLIENVRGVGYLLNLAPDKAKKPR